MTEPTQMAFFAEGKKEKIQSQENDSQYEG
jgi:hypothetical protein